MIMGQYATIEKCLWLCVCLGCCLIGASGETADSNMTAQAESPPTLKASSPFDQTREELFLDVFKHPSPRIPVNCYVSLVVDGFRRGKIQAELAPDQKDIRVEGSAILANLAPLLRPEIVNRIESEIDAQGWLRRTVLDAEGMATSFDTKNFIFTIMTDPAKRETQITNMSREMIDPYTAEGLRPAPVSAFLNLSGKAVSRTVTGTGATNEDPLQLGLGADGAVNVGGVVFEGSGFVQSEDKGGVRRGDLRVVYDQPQRALRYTAGDLQYSVVGYQQFESMGGVGISKDFSLQPHVPAYRTGDYSFYLERPAKVKVWVNDSLVRTLHLAAGQHDIRGFTPDAGQNEIRLEIDDDTGRRQVLRFSFIRDPLLLDKSRSLFSYNAGFRREIVDGLYRYDETQPLLSASYMKGVSEVTTMGGYGQFDQSHILLGTQVARAFSFGTLEWDAAASRSEDSGWEPGTKLVWTRVAGPRAGMKVASQLSLEYLGENFGSAGGDTSGQGDTVNCLASLAFPVGYGIYSRVSGNYSSRLGSAPDEYGATVTLSRKWGKYITTSVAVRHRLEDGNKAETEFLFGVSLFYSSGKNSVYASKEMEGDMTLGWDYGNSSDVSTPSGFASSRFGDDGREYRAGVGYLGELGAVEVAHDRSERDGNRGSSSEDETTLRVESALVFADGTLAVTHPIRDNFVIVQGENGLKGVDLRVDPDGEGGSRARSGWLSPAVLTDVPNYRAREVRVVPVNPPIGTTPDKTTFLLLPTYKSGALLKLGEELRIVAIGRLVDGQKVPLAHLPINVWRVDDDKGEPIFAFTSRNGSFQVPNIKPGRYEICPSSDSAWGNVTVEIHETPDGLYRLGDVALPVKP